MSGQDEFFMRHALRQAHLAMEEGDVPMGAVITRGNTIIGQAHNQIELLKDPTAHAEMIAITQAAGVLRDWRLLDTTLYVTKEPCPMCTGAITLARIPRLVFGAPDPEYTCDIPSIEIMRDVLLEECRQILQDFFQNIRGNKPNAK